MFLFTVLLSRGEQDLEVINRLQHRSAEKGEFMAHHSICRDCCRPQPQSGLRLPSYLSMISFYVFAAKESSGFILAFLEKSQSRFPHVSCSTMQRLGQS